MQQIYVTALRPAYRGGIDVFTSVGVYRNVIPNVVRCALGKDVDYLLQCPTDGEKMFRPLTKSECREFVAYKQSR